MCLETAPPTTAELQDFEDLIRRGDFPPSTSHPQPNPTLSTFGVWILKWIKGWIRNPKKPLWTAVCQTYRKRVSKKIERGDFIEAETNSQQWVCLQLWESPPSLLDFPGQWQWQTLHFPDQCHCLRYKRQKEVDEQGKCRHLYKYFNPFIETVVYLCVP